MVSYTAFLLLTCCSCLQHTGAQSSGPSALSRYKRGAGKKVKTTTSNTLVVHDPFIAKAPCDLTWTTTNPPIILHEDTRGIVHPTTLTSGTKIIRIKADVGVIVSCPGTGGFSSPEKLRPQNLRSKLFGFSAFCNSADGKLVVNRERSEPLSMFSTPPQPRIHGPTVNNMNDMLCENKIEDTVIATPEHCGHGMKYNIVTFEQEFFIQVEVCFDTAKKTTLWTRHTLLHDTKPSGRGAATWKPDQLFNDPKTHKDWIEMAYEGEHHRDLLKKKLKQNVIYPSSESRPSNKPAGLFFAKGHLSPDADFVTPAERRATYHYINALPQWQSDNNGNWKNIVEASVRTLATVGKEDLLIITGGHRILNLKNNQGTPVPIFLKESPDQVPVPELMWKVVINKAKPEGVAFVVSNDPYIGQSESPTTKIEIPAKATDLEPMCTSVCAQLDKSWFKLNDPKHTTTVKLDNYGKGYTYCCKVSDLMSKITTIPTHYEGVDLRIVGLLTGQPSSGK